MAWTFEQGTGRLLSQDGSLLTTGYSGAVGYKNNPRMQDVKGKGPIPQGTYTIEAPRDTPDHGPEAMPLAPDSENEMFGRLGFWIHGDSMHAPGTASEGCVILPRFARERVWQSGDHTLRVVREVLTIV
jgi:hypothetical protein